MKGHNALIEALSRIAAEVPQLVLLIAGEGELKQELEQQIEQSGLKGRVHLLGHQDRESVLSIVKSSDIFAMPSNYEGTPIALLEAAALARPILATRAGGIPEMVENGEHAILVEPGDVLGLSAGLLKLAQDKDFSRSLGLRAQNWTKQRFSVERQLAETWDAYRKAWSRHFGAVQARVATGE
jgi:glycosyltransferase involved in cell wall biosynthesis